MISYKEMMGSHKLNEFDSHNQNPMDIGRTEVNKMTEEINWDSALAGEGKFVKLEEGKRVTLVAKNARFEKVEKEFKGQEAKMMTQLLLDVVEEEGLECAKELSTLSKRFMGGLRPLFENVAPEVEVRFSVKKIGTGTDTNYDVEKL